LVHTLEGIKAPKVVFTSVCDQTIRRELRRGIPSAEHEGFSPHVVQWSWTFVLPVVVEGLITPRTLLRDRICHFLYFTYLHSLADPDYPAMGVGALARAIEEEETRHTERRDT
jgi:hypothetical protein